MFLRSPKYGVGHRDHESWARIEECPCEGTGEKESGPSGGGRTGEHNAEVALADRVELRRSGRVPTWVSRYWVGVLDVLHG